MKASKEENLHRNSLCVVVCIKIQESASIEIRCVFMALSILGTCTCVLFLACLWLCQYKVNLNTLYVLMALSMLDIIHKMSIDLSIQGKLIFILCLYDFVIWLCE